MCSSCIYSIRICKVGVEWRNADVGGCRGQFGIVVNMNEVLEFVNEKTKVLMILKENPSEIDGKKICSLNQQEIADLISCGKLKVNQMIKELIEQEDVEMLHSKGRYLVTEKGNDVLRKVSLN